MIIWVSVVLRRTDCDDIDWRFDNQSESKNDSDDDYIQVIMNQSQDDYIHSTQVVETSVNVTTNSPSQDYTHPDDHTSLTYNMTIIIIIIIIISTFIVTKSLNSERVEQPFEVRTGGKSILVKWSHFFYYSVICLS